MTNIYKLYTDGASRGNPGKSGIGAFICDNNNKSIKEIYKFIGINTNNFAEYTAMIEGLKACLKLKIHSIQVFTDSELVTRQLNGIYKVKNKNLIPLYLEIQKLKPKFKEISFHHVRREFNKKADELANLGIDLA